MIGTHWKPLKGHYAGIIALALLAPAASAQSRPAPSPRGSGDVFSSSNCRAQYQRQVQQISAQHVEQAKGCRGAASCIAAADQQKATALQAAGRKLNLCQNVTPESGPSPSRPKPDDPPDFGKPDVPPPTTGQPPVTPPPLPPPTKGQPPSRTDPPPTKAKPPPARPPGWEIRGPSLVYTDVKGGQWKFAPSFKDPDGRIYVLERNTAQLRRSASGREVVVCTYVWKDRLNGTEDRVTVDGKPMS